MSTVVEIEKQLVLAKNLEKLNISEEQHREILSYSRFKGRLKKFRNKHSLDSFQRLFGKDEGERLIKHFRGNVVQEDFEKFKTFLTADQSNLLYAEIVNLDFN